MTDIGAHHFNEERNGVLSFVQSGWQDIASAIACAVLPPLCFIVFNGLSIGVGFEPGLPVPVYMSDSVGVVLFLALYPATGLAFWAAAREGERGASAAHWTLALILSLIAYPFLMALCGVEGQSVLTALLLLLALAAGSRLFKVSTLAGCLVLPLLVWSGAGAFLGIAAISGGWTPPFGPTQQAA